jgi:hypothetical protein
MRKATHTEVYNQLSDLKIERKEIFRLMSLAVERAEEHNEVAVWKPEALESNYMGSLYLMVFECEIVDEKEQWYIYE